MPSPYRDDCRNRSLLNVPLCRYDRGARQWSPYPLPADEGTADRQ